MIGYHGNYDLPNELAAMATCMVVMETFTGVELNIFSTPGSSVTECTSFC